MAEKKKAKAPAKAKKAAPAKKAAKKAPAKEKEAAATPSVAAAANLQGLDRKGLAARARQLKKELLAIRFNPQAPSLKDYRIKKRELSTVLARLGSR